MHQVIVSSRTALSSSQLKKLTTSLDQKYGDDYQLAQVIKPELISGITVQLDSEFYDASILGKLQNLKQELSKQV